MTSSTGVSRSSSPSGPATSRKPTASPSVERAQRHRQRPLGLDRSALEQHLGLGDDLAPVAEHLGDRQSRGPVEHHPEGAVVADVEHQNDGVGEVRVQQHRGGQQQHPGLDLRHRPIIAQRAAHRKAANDRIENGGPGPTREGGRCVGPGPPGWEVSGSGRDDRLEPLEQAGLLGASSSGHRHAALVAPAGRSPRSWRRTAPPSGRRRSTGRPSRRAARAPWRWPSPSPWPSPRRWARPGSGPGSLRTPGSSSAAWPQATSTASCRSIGWVTSSRSMWPARRVCHFSCRAASRVSSSPKVSATPETSIGRIPSRRTPAVAITERRISPRL